MWGIKTLGIGLLILAASSCTKGGDSKTLHIYSALDAEELQKYIPEYEKKSGVKVQFVRMSAGEVLARLEAEKGNPQVSLWFGGPAAEHIAALKRGLLEPYQPKTEYEIKPPFRDPEWGWVGFYFGAIGFACNGDFIKKKSVACPTTWQELLKPEYKGQISLAFPYTSGTAYTVVASLLKHFGDEKGWSYITQLDKQVHHYNSSGSAAVTQAGLGEVGLGIAFSHDILKKGKAKGYPVSLSIPSDGTGTEIGAVSLVKGGKQPELAKDFVNWVLSKDGQNLLAEFFRVPLHPEAKVAEGSVTAKQVKVIDVDAGKAADQQKEILARWRKITGR